MFKLNYPIQVFILETIKDCYYNAAMPQIINQLRKVEALQDVPEYQLQWMAEKGKVQKFKAGDYVFKKDEPLTKMVIVLSGIISLKISQNGQFKEIDQITTGEIGGILPYSRAIKSTGSGVVEADCSIFILDKFCFEEMINNHHELTTVLVHIMASRIREFTAAQQQDDKMMALGKLSAGLAHELNNPASAVVRSSSELKKVNEILPSLVRKVVSLDINSEKMEAINQLFLNKAKTRIDLSLKDRTALEDQITDWLEDHSIEEPYEIAEVLSDNNFTSQDLELIREKVETSNLKPLLDWLTQSLIFNKLVNEIQEGSKRISDLVHAIKSYSHMDRSPDKELLDIHDGINNTLTMLSHKLKAKKVDVEKEFSDSLPKVKAYAGTLNQVWTNLIDNAVDAMEEGGTLTIRTFPENGNVKIDIIDNGSGIDESVKSKIFDPFYTTKDIGKGTGLGLDIVRNIISQHQGSINVESEPGQTKFQICLPVEK